jgi:hypothetical protein
MNDDPNYGSINVKMGSYNMVGHIGHKITYNSPPARDLNEPQCDPLKRQLLEHTQGYEKVVVAGVAGDYEADQLAGQIASFLQANGREVKVISYMSAPPPRPGITLMPDGGIIVGARA